MADLQAAVGVEATNNEVQTRHLFYSSEKALAVFG